MIGIIITIIFCTSFEFLPIKSKLKLGKKEKNKHIFGN